MRTLEALARRLKPPPGLPALWLVTDPRRLPDPLPAAALLPRHGRAGVLARGLDAPALARLAALARARGLVLLVAGDGRAALRHHAGLHLPERRGTTGLLPFLSAARHGRRPAAPAPPPRRRGGGAAAATGGGAPRWARLSLAAHGGAAAAARARRLGADLAFLSPAFLTASHPGQPALGPLRWAALARALPCPAAALGGVGPRSAARLPRRRLAGLAAIEGLRHGAAAAAAMAAPFRPRQGRC